jgi:hypothetical protein
MTGNIKKTELKNKFINCIRIRLIAIKPFTSFIFAFANFAPTIEHIAYPNPSPTA